MERDMNDTEERELNGPMVGDQEGGPFEPELIPVTLTSAQWSALLEMVSEGIEQSQYRISEGFAYQDGGGGEEGKEYERRLEAVSDLAAAAAQSAWDQIP